MSSHEEIQKVVERYIKETPAFGYLNEEEHLRRDEILNSLHTFFQTDKRYRLISKMQHEQTFELRENLAPFNPIDYFKRKDIAVDGSYRMLTSSGTSTSAKSKIMLSKRDALNQRVVLSKILSTFFGAERRPMLFLADTLQDNSKSEFSASRAAIAGFSLLSRESRFLGNNDDARRVVKEFCSEYSGENPIIFGFTSKIFEVILKEDEIIGHFPNVTIIHGGGWKKLQKQSISKSDFRERVRNVLGTDQLHDYYGMAEQSGSIYLECNQSKYHISNFSELLIRDGTLQVAGNESLGVIQTISFSQASYPGFSLLTKDLGRLTTSLESICKCGIPGKTFEIIGRIDSADIRGCSDSV